MMLLILFYVQSNMEGDILSLPLFLHEIYYMGYNLFYPYTYFILFYPINRK